jgi:hypothetical protein
MTTRREHAVDEATGGRRCRRDRGVALIEFALLLPILAIIVFGTIDLGRAFQLKNQLKNAAREGAAYAQVQPARQVSNTGVCANPNNIRHRAQKELPNNGTGFTILVTPPDSSTLGSPNGCETVAGYAPGEEITVAARRDFDVFTPLVGAITGDPITITETVTVVIQGND